MNTLRSKEHHILLELLKEVRKNAGFRQVDLAEKIGVPQSMISKYEVGERRIDLLETRAICDALGLSLSKFIQLFERRLSEMDNETN